MEISSKLFFPQFQTFAHFRARECACSCPLFDDTDGAKISVKSDDEQGCSLVSATDLWGTSTKMLGFVLGSWLSVA